MKWKAKKTFLISLGLFLNFVMFTVFVLRFNVKPIGPEQSTIGFSGINQFVFQRLGVRLVWYNITDWIGIIPILFALGFAAVGLYQLIKRKSIWKVDRSILMLGLFYLLVIAVYQFFEQVVVNYRPIILGEGGLEASYPSSHTMIVVCIMKTAAMQFHVLWPNKKNLCLGIDIFAAVLITITVVGRLISGVHWFTDIVGGLLLSAALVTLYCAAIEYIETQNPIE